MMPRRFSLPMNMCRTAFATALVAGLAWTSAQPVQAARIENRVAVFSGIDKITGETHTFDVYIDETVKFGQLEITPRVCFSRPATEEPKTTSFLEVDEITLDRRIRRIFTGWMFAESPGLNAIEHPINDVWLVTCKQTSDVPPPPDSVTSAPAPSGDGSEQPTSSISN